MAQKFIQNKTNEINFIKSEDNNYYYLDNNKQILKDLFMSTYSPITEDSINETVKPVNNDLVDPNTFFNNSGVAGLGDSFKSIPDNTPNIPNTPLPSTVADLEKQREIELEIEIAQKKRLLIQEIQSNKNNNVKQLDDFADIDDEIALNGRNSKNIPKQSTPEAKQKNIEKMIFNSFKRNHKIKINLTFDDKIANPLTVQMIQNDIEGDIIQYYTDELVDSIFNDLDSIKKVIYAQYDFIINGEKKKAKISKPKIKKNEDTNEGNI